MVDTSLPTNEKKKSGAWHYQPAVPIQTNPLFEFPPNPMKVFKWYAASWLHITQFILFALLAHVMWYFFQPNYADINFETVISVHIRNLALMIVIAGSIHLYLYSFKMQKKKFKYDPRDLQISSRRFSFKNQIHDNIFWSLVSGVSFWTFYEVLLFWGMEHGFAPQTSFASNPLWYVILFLLIPMWESFYFYWIHRMLHIPFLFKHVHSLHHRNINVGPWSGLSMHPIEHLIFVGSPCIHFLIPSSPVHIMFHCYVVTLFAATTHTGYAGLAVGEKNKFALGTYHHQMHHRYFDCNYGNLEIPLDKWFSSFKDGSNETTHIIKPQ